MSKSATPVLPIHNDESVADESHAHPRPTTASTITAGYALLSPQETAQRLSTSVDVGLSPTEAQSRLIKNGPNELPHEEEEPLWLRFLKQFKETLILLLLASAVISFFIGNTDDSVSITLAVTIVVTVGFVQEYRSEKSLEALSKLIPHSAHIRRGGESSRARTIPHDRTAIELEPLTNGSTEKVSSNVPAAQLVVGDVVLFATGDRIPADIRITKAADLSIDESNLTGENEPVHKYSETLHLEHLQKETDESRSTTPLPYGVAAGTVGADVRLNEQHNIASTKVNFQRLSQCCGIFIGNSLEELVAHSYSCL